MEKMDKWVIEKELQRALATEYVRSYCKLNNLSIIKLTNEIFHLSYNECGFSHPSGIEPDGLCNDIETQPKVTLVIKHKNGMLFIEQTEYTREFLSE